MEMWGIKVGLSFSFAAPWQHLLRLHNIELACNSACLRLKVLLFGNSGGKQPGVHPTHEANVPCVLQVRRHSEAL